MCSRPRGPINSTFLLVPNQFADQLGKQASVLPPLDFQLLWWPWQLLSAGYTEAHWSNWSAKWLCGFPGFSPSVQHHQHRPPLATSPQRCFVLSLCHLITFVQLFLGANTVAAQTVLSIGQDSNKASDCLPHKGSVLIRILPWGWHAANLFTWQHKGKAVSCDTELIR